MTRIQLCLHTGDTDRVTRDTLRALPLPQPLSRRHRPVPHLELVEGIQDQLDRRGLAIRREQLALRRDGQRLFGTMDLTWQTQAPAAPEEGLALGLRQGDDLSHAIEIVAGARIFVCDNLTLYGDVIAVRKKHTSCLPTGSCRSGSSTTWTGPTSGPRPAGPTASPAPCVRSTTPAPGWPGRSP